MFGSKNDYFKKDLDYLIRDRKKLNFILQEIWGLNNNQISLYLEAFDYFILHPNEYDGATIVNDFWIIPNLDIWAMIHDYMYLKFNVAVNVKYKFIADYIYCKEMRKFKISWGAVWLTRFLGLTLSGVLFIPREILFNKKVMSYKNKQEFKKYINKK